MTIGQRIKESRKKAGLTQRELAEKSGTATGTIQQYELGKRQPRIEQLQRIATALAVHPGELMGLIDYGDNIWGPEGLISDDLDDVRQRTLAISENQKALNRLKERMAKKEHITGKLELLNDDGLDTAVQAIDVIVGNPKLSTYPSSPPYFQPTEAPKEGKAPDAPESPPEGE